MEGRMTYPLLLHVRILARANSILEPDLLRRERPACLIPRKMGSSLAFDPLVFLAAWRLILNAALFLTGAQRQARAFLQLSLHTLVVTLTHWTIVEPSQKR